MTYPEAIVQAAQIAADAYVAKHQLDVLMFCIGMFTTVICVSFIAWMIRKACMP